MKYKECYRKACPENDEKNNECNSPEWKFCLRWLPQPPKKPEKVEP